MTKGAKAMVAACLFPEKEKGGRGKKAPVAGTFLDIDQRRISEARTSSPSHPISSMKSRLGSNPWPMPTRRRRPRSRKARFHER
jgi:hypothetical protein